MCRVNHSYFSFSNVGSYGILDQKDSLREWEQPHALLCYWLLSMHIMQVVWIYKDFKVDNFSDTGCKSTIVKERAENQSSFHRSKTTSNKTDKVIRRSCKRKLNGTGYVFCYLDHACQVMCLDTFVSLVFSTFVALWTSITIKKCWFTIIRKLFYTPSVRRCPHLTIWLAPHSGIGSL